MPSARHERGVKGSNQPKRRSLFAQQGAEADPNAGAPAILDNNECHLPIPNPPAFRTQEVFMSLVKKPVLTEEKLAANRPAPAETLQMGRVQDANMREVRRLSNWLLKIQRRQGPEAPDSSAQAAVSYDVSENKSA